MNETPNLEFPVFLWQEGYIYLATTPLELCAHPRSMFSETVRKARAKKIHLLDASGRLFDVEDWDRVRPFGGVRMLGYLLLGSIFAKPKLVNERKLSLVEFKEKLMSAVRSRYRYDSDKDHEVEIARKLESANSFKSALSALQY